MNVSKKLSEINADKNKATIIVVIIKQLDLIQFMAAASWSDKDRSVAICQSNKTMIVLCQLNERLAKSLIYLCIKPKILPIALMFITDRVPASWILMLRTKSYRKHMGNDKL